MKPAGVPQRTSRKPTVKGVAAGLGTTSGLLLAAVITLTVLYVLKVNCSTKCAVCPTCKVCKPCAPCPPNDCTICAPDCSKCPVPGTDCSKCPVPPPDCTKCTGPPPTPGIPKPTTTSTTSLGTYYPLWDDWPGRWFNGSNTAYASFRNSMMQLAKSSLPTLVSGATNNLPVISRVYMGFFAPNPSLANVIVNWDSTLQNPVYGNYPIFIESPLVGNPPTAAPGSAFPCPSWLAPNATTFTAPPSANTTTWLYLFNNDPTTQTMFAPYRNAGWSPKFIASIGGWSYSRKSNIPGSDNYFAPFQTMSDAQMVSWATAAMWFAQYWGFDGIDIDYELPNTTENYSANSILPRLATAFNTAITTNRAAFSQFSQNISVTVQGSYVEVGGALVSTGPYGFINNETLRVVNLMLYDSGGLSQYEPRAFGDQFITANNAPGLTGLPSSKLGFGLEIVPQATGPGIGPYTMDPYTAQTLAYYAANRPGGAFKEIFFWMFSLPDLAPQTFSTYMQWISAGAFPLTYSGYDPTLTQALPFYWFVTSAMYYLGPINVMNSKQWIPGQPPPNSVQGPRRVPRPYFLN